MKKLFALVLALVMIMSLAATGFATGEVTEDTATKNDRITVTGTKSGETYKLYKMFDLVVNDEITPTTYVYTVNTAWSDFFTTGEGKNYVTIDAQGYVTAVSNAATLAEEAAKVAKNKTELQSQSSTGANVVFDGLENGYYLITSSLGTKAMIETTPDKADVTINEKNPEDTIEKFVQEDSKSGDEAWGEENDAQVGDTVNFKSNATLNPNTTNVKIYDTMTAGLTYNNDVAIDGLTVGTDYAVVNKADGFVITFTETYLASLTEVTELTLTYSAVLNEKAVVTVTGEGEDATTTPGINEQTNTTQITYGDKQSVEDQTKTTTHKSTVNKYAAGVENLAGAVFSLKKNGTVVKLVKLDDINYRVATATEIATEGATTDTFETVSTGNIVIWGLDSDDDYTLAEITAPDGYNKLSDEVEMAVNADNSSVTKVENKSGTELPSTGGMGTTLFYVVGGIMVLAAVVLLVTKKRMAVEG